MKFLWALSMVLVGCSAPTSQTVTNPSAMPIAIVPSNDAPILVPQPDVNQLSFATVSPAQIKVQSGAALALNFTVTDPLNKHTCTWWREVPPQPLVPAGQAKAIYGTVNNTDCTPMVHNQTNQLNYNWWVYVSNGETTISYAWNLTYVAVPPSDPVAVSAVTAEGTYRVFSTKLFEVHVTDLDLAGVCTWKLDGVLKSNSCTSYTHTQDSSNHSLVFAIASAVNTAIATWTVKPQAHITSLTPATGLSGQAFTAVISDPNSSGGYCRWYLDGVVQNNYTGQLSYTYSGTGTHVVSVDVAYLGGDLNGTPLTAYALPPVVSPVNVVSSFPIAKEIYLPVGTLSPGVAFGVDDFQDPGGTAWFEWYVDGVKVDCTASSWCQYSGSVKGNGRDGILFKGLPAVGGAILKVVLTNGLYSSSRNWLVHSETATIDENQPTGGCNTAGTSFWIYGKGFESSDVVTLQNQNIVLNKVLVSDFAMHLTLPQAVSAGTQAIQIVKTWSTTINQAIDGTTGSQVKTSISFITFDSCP